MENQPKVNYQVVLRKVAEQAANEVATPVQEGHFETAVDIIYEAMRKETLKSWKNGLDQGRRETRKPQLQPKA